MISEFLCAAIGSLSYYDREKSERVYATEFIQYGSSKADDGWWNAEKMVQQTRKAVEVFKQAFPNDIVVFAFHNSSGHTCKAPDALVATRMNLTAAGKQPAIHPTRLTDGTLQYMVYHPNDREWDYPHHPVKEEYIEKPKGINRVLQEHGLWRNGLLKQCGCQKKSKRPSHMFSDRSFEEMIDEYEACTIDRCEVGKACHTL